MESGGSGGIRGMSGGEFKPLGPVNDTTSGAQQVQEAYFKGEEMECNPNAEAMESALEASDLGEEFGLMRSATGEKIKLKEKEDKGVSKRSASTSSKEKSEAADAVEEVHESAQHLQTSEEIKKKFGQLLPDMNEGQLEEFYEHLGDQEEQLTGYSDTKMLKEAKEFFKDPSHQYAAIEYARAKLKESMDNPNLTAAQRDQKSKLLNILQKGSNRLLREEGTAVRAGLNVSALAAVSQKQGLGTIEGLRNMYRNEILGHEDIVSTFKIMVKMFGASRIKSGVGFVLEAASSDLNAEESSIEKGKLHDIIGDIFKMQTLSGMFNRIQAFLDILEKEDPETTPAA
jgi:type III secretion protein W